MSTSGLVGRDRQLAALRGLLDLAGRGDGGVALVRGDAGTGKTSLVGELIDAARHDKATVLAGGCVAVGSEPLRHAALIELVRAAGAHGGRRGDPPVDARAAGDGPPGIAGLTSEAVLERLLSILDRLLTRSTVLVVVEDLHWADRGTCEILAVLARHTAHRRLAVVITSRDDEMPHGHPVRNVLAELARAPRASSVELGPLSAAEVARLVEHLAGPVPASAAAALYERSGGNPLLVEELCSAGRAAGERGNRRGEPPVPHTGALRDILLARWAGLADDARTAVGAAAVAGSPVTVEGVAAVLGWGHDDAAPAVRAAVDRHVLVVSGDHVAFRHVLTAEAVYRELLPSERIRLHERWARLLTGVGADEDGDALLERVAATDAHEQAPRIAHHWEAADRPAAAFVAALRAAEGALAALAVETAHHHYAAALAHWPRVPAAASWFARVMGGDPPGPARLELCRQVAEMANFAGDPAAAVAAVDEALRDPGAADPAAASVLLERRGWYLLRQGAIGEAGVAYQRALATLPADAPASTRAGVLAGAVRTYERAGQWDQALALAREALAAGQAASHPSGRREDGPAPEEVDARYMLGRVLLVTGANAEAEAELGRTATDAEAIGDPVNLAIALREQADALARHGRLPDALATASETEQRLRARGRVDPDALLVAAVAGSQLHRMGRFAEARALGTRLRDEAGTPVARALAHLLAGLLDLEDLALETAREHLELARFLAGPLLDGRINGAVASGRAELALAEGSIDAARAAVDEGVGAVRHSGDDEVLAHLCLLGLRIERAAAARAAGRESAGVQRRRDQRRDELEDHLRTVLAVPPPGADRPDLAAVDAAWRAEVDEDAEPGRWDTVEAGWDAVGWPRWAAYAAIRRVEATARDVRSARSTRSTAAGDESLARALAAAEARVTALGSAVLRAELAALAQRIGHALDAGPDPATAPGSPGDEGLARLTRRELEVLDLVASGSTNRQIAERLFISEKTASVHVSRILTKLGAADRREASALARRARRR